MSMGEEGEKDRCLSDIESVTRSAMKLATQFLTFSQGGSPVKQHVSLNPMVEEIARFLLRGKSIRLEMDLVDSNRQAEVDMDQISQVLHNIIINAVHAMNSEGLLKIAVRERSFSSTPTLFLASGDYLEITIEDNGCGISKEEIDKVFDPYYSTKDDGNGFGLATSLTIVRKHGGDILVESELGKGTVFTIFLPSAKSVVHKENVRKEKPLVNQKMNILVLEDDRIIAKVLLKSLAVLGHEAIVCHEGNECVHLFQEAYTSGKRFNLLILDLTISGGMGARMH